MFTIISIVQLHKNILMRSGDRAEFTLDACDSDFSQATDFDPKSQHGSWSNQMSNTSLVIRRTKERQPRLGIAVGCMLALTCVFTHSADAQVVQTAGENQSEVLGISAQLASGDSGRFSSRRVLVQVPQKGELSPNEINKAGEASDDNQAGEKSADIQADDKTADADKKEGDVKQESGKGITPVQSAGLKLNVVRVNISTNTIGTGVLPDDTAANRAPPSMGLLDGQSRGIVAQQVNWRPANVCYFPLYFEDAMLERHGHVRWGHAQPIVSGVKFLSTLPLLPYLKTMHPPCEPRYALGHFRPGSCAPALKDHLPWDSQAATVEAISLGAFFWAAPL